MTDNNAISGEFGGVPYQDLYLVRVQNSFSSDSVENGMLTLNRQGSGRADSMNTFHFTINAVVENHFMGTQFNDAECVVIAPLVRTVIEGQNIPHGFLPADTYFEADAEGKINLPGAQLLVPEGMDIPEELESITRRYERSNTPAETMTNRNLAVESIFESLNAPFFHVGFDDWLGNSDGTKYEKFARYVIPGYEHDIGRHEGNPSNYWAMIVAKTHGYLADYKAGEKLHADGTGRERHLYDLIREAPAEMAEFIRERKARNADPKAISFYERQFEDIKQQLLTARPVRAQELREWRAHERAERIAEQSSALQPPPLPAWMSTHAANSFDVSANGIPIKDVTPPLEETLKTPPVLPSAGQHRP